MPTRLPVVLIAVVALAMLSSCGDEGESARDTSSQAATSEPSQSSSGDGSGISCDYPDDGSEPAKQVEPPQAEATVTGKVAVTISTSAGDIAAKLDADAAPCTVNNFLSLADQSYFDDTQCHRLTTQGIFVLQCGDPTASGMGGPGYTIPDELSGEETYPAGTLAMAKTAFPDSGGSQFFMVYGDTALPPEYTVFGHLDGASVKTLEGVAEKGTSTGDPDGPPKETVTIQSVTER